MHFLDNRSSSAETYFLCTHPFGTDLFRLVYPHQGRNVNPSCLVHLNTFLFVKHSFVVIRQMLTFYPLLRFESCWTLTFRSLQVIKIAAACCSRPCRLTSSDTMAGSHPPIPQRSPVGDPRMRNPVLKDSASRDTPRLT